MNTWNSRIEAEREWDWLFRAQHYYAPIITTSPCGEFARFKKCSRGDKCHKLHGGICFDEIKRVALNFADENPHDANAIKIHQFLEQRALKKAASILKPVEVNVPTSPPVITTVKKPRISHAKVRADVDAPHCVDAAAGSLAHVPKDEVPVPDVMTTVCNGLVAVLRKYGSAVHMCVFVCLLGLMCMN